MEINEEMKAAARQLGESLRQEVYVHNYLEAMEGVQKDPRASALEKEMYDEYEALIARQIAGEEPGPDEASTFYELRQQVQEHPLIIKRTKMLRLARPCLAQVAEEISFLLDLDYAALARPE